MWAEGTFSSRSLPSDVTVTEAVAVPNVSGIVNVIGTEVRIIYAAANSGKACCGCAVYIVIERHVIETKRPVRACVHGSVIARHGIFKGDRCVRNNRLVRIHNDARYCP